MEQSSQQTTSEFLRKKIIVTGASSGIGQACAMYFLNAGASVILAGKDTDSMRKIGEQFPNQAAIIKIDLNKDMAIYDFKSSVVEILGTIDIIVNCAGIMFDGDVEKTFPQDFDYSVDVNLRSVYEIIKNTKQFLVKGSSIINVSCLYGTRPWAGMISYSMCKAGLETLTKFAAAEYAESGIRINAVTACPVDSNALRYVGVGEKEFSDFKTRVAKNIPLGRIAQPDDVAKAIIFLASSRSSKITGQVIKVDGGRALTTSGWVPFKGMKNMNARFEPDGVPLGFKLTETMNKLKRSTVTYPTTQEAIERLILDSNWSTRLSDAHQNVNANYKNVELNDDVLLNRYVNRVVK